MGDCCWLALQPPPSSFMPRIDAQGNIVPDGTPPPPPELPGGAKLWVVLLLCAVVACFYTVPSQQSFEKHIEIQTASAIEQAIQAMTTAGGGTPGGMFGLFGIHGIEALRTIFEKMLGAVLPISYQRRDYGIACVYVLAGDKHDDFIRSDEMTQNAQWMKEVTTAEKLRKLSLSSKYLGIGGRWFAIGQHVAAISNPAKRTATEPGERPETAENVGGDRDEHGCIGSAGYQWCESKKKCLRTWEEDCPDANGHQSSGSDEEEDEEVDEHEADNQDPEDHGEDAQSPPEPSGQDNTKSGRDQEL